MSEETIGQAIERVNKETNDILQTLRSELINAANKMQTENCLRALGADEIIIPITANVGRSESFMNDEEFVKCLKEETFRSIGINEPVLPQHIEFTVQHDPKTFKGILNEG